MWTHVFWDMGGTIVDTYPQLDQTFADVITAEGHTITLDEVARLTRVSTGHAVKALSEQFDIPQEAFRTAEKALKTHWVEEPPPAMPHLSEAMEAVPGLNFVVTHRERRSASALLDALSLTVDDMLCAPDGFRRKPDPEMYLELVRRHGLDPATCVGIGDRPIDAEAAHAAGMGAVMLETPGIPMDNPADEEITTLEALPPLLGC